VEGLLRALKAAKSDNGAFDAMNFLGRLRFKEDRFLIENWLHDPSFSTGSSSSSSSSEPSHDHFSYFAASSRREQADRILARWDKITSATTDEGMLENYSFLGTLRGTILLPQAPQKGQGALCIYLVPVSRSLSDWASVRPEHYLLADLSELYPVVFGREQVQDGKLSTNVNFVIYGVTPGKYRIKAIWNKTWLSGSPNDVIMHRLQRGDFQSSLSPIITVSRGVATKPVTIECKNSVS
jgi:hypothetical protein